MRKSVFHFAVLFYLNGIATAAPPPDAVELAKREQQTRETLTTKSTAVVDQDEDLTVHALVSIINDESKRGGNDSLKHRALRELGRHPDSELAIKILIREIEFEPAQIGGAKDILQGYTAAKALVKMGFSARVKLIRSLGKPLAEPELHLRAHVLARMDGDLGAGSDGTEVTLLRLRRELKLRKEDPEPPGAKETKAAVIFNLERIISILEEPGFFGAAEFQLPASNGGDAEWVCEIATGSVEASLDWVAA